MAARRSSCWRVGMSAMDTSGGGSRVGATAVSTEVTVVVARTVTSSPPDDDAGSPVAAGGWT